MRFDENQPLDAHHVLEPVEGGVVHPGEPLVRDAAGRLWRVRWRPGPTDVLAAGAGLLIAALVLALVLLWL